MKLTNTFWFEVDHSQNYQPEKHSQENSLVGWCLDSSVQGRPKHPQFREQKRVRPEDCVLSNLPGELPPGLLLKYSQPLVQILYLTDAQNLTEG